MSKRANRIFTVLWYYAEYPHILIPKVIFAACKVRSRKNSVDIRDGNEPWGWFEDVEAFSSGIRACKDGNDIPSKEKMKYTLSAEDLKMLVAFFVIENFISGVITLI